MTEEQRVAIKRSIEAWQRAEPELMRVRKEDIRAADTVASIAAYRGLVLAKSQTHPPVATSGLIEQQRYFARLAGKR